MGLSFYYIPRSQPPLLEQHTAIPFKQPPFGLWKWETLKEFEKIIKILEKH